MDYLIVILWFFAALLGTLFGGLFLVHVRDFSEKFADFCCKAPGLDLLVALFSWVPWVLSGCFSGWLALLACVVGQAIGLMLWCRVHEFYNKKATEGPRIVKYLNGRVGRLNNHLALWVTALSVPMFWSVRFAEILTYPLLVWTVKLPKYKSSEWVNVSRTKYDGLVGHDLIWCLYCDWMTGVWSLGTEMLRNVESFWCPIKFYDGKKCENCKIDFPDLENGWVKPDGTMQDVVDTLEKHYDKGDHSWFGHPGRKESKGGSCGGSCGSKK